MCGINVNRRGKCSRWDRCSSGGPKPRRRDAGERRVPFGPFRFSATGGSNLFLALLMRKCWIMRLGCAVLLPFTPTRLAFATTSPGSRLKSKISPLQMTLLLESGVGRVNLSRPWGCHQAETRYFLDGSSVSSDFVTECSSIMKRSWMPGRSARKFPHHNATRRSTSASSALNEVSEVYTFGVMVSHLNLIKLSASVQLHWRCCPLNTDPI